MFSMVLSHSWGADSPVTNSAETYTVSFLTTESLASKGVCVGLARADSNGLADVENENLAVADLVDIGAFTDSTDRALGDVIVNGHFDFCLWDEMYFIFCAAIPSDQQRTRSHAPC